LLSPKLLLQQENICYRCTKRLTNCKQKYFREEELAAQIKSFIQKVSLCDDWTKKILEQLEKDNNSSVQSSLPQQQNLETKIKEVDARISKLIDVYLAESLTLEEYQTKKEALSMKRGNYKMTYGILLLGQIIGSNRRGNS